MTTIIEQTLELEEIDKNLYRSVKLWKPIGARGVFGGQTIGLALHAASKTVDPTFVVNSLHCYFLLAGDDQIPIIFRVYIVRTGGSYCSRSVSATQNGKTIFSMMASFAKPEISRLNYQPKMPNVPHPDKLSNDEDILKSWLENPKAAKYHASIRMRLNQPISIEIKRVRHTPGSQKHMIWMKAKGKLPDVASVHQCVAAYCSDHELLNSALVPFDLAKYTTKRLLAIKMMASLDHSIWFHESFRADEWLLYEMESSKSGAGRGFSQARAWNLQERLVFSTAQEGLIRLHEDAKL